MFYKFCGLNLTCFRGVEKRDTDDRLVGLVKPRSLLQRSVIWGNPSICEGSS